MNKWLTEGVFLLVLIISFLWLYLVWLSLSPCPHKSFLTMKGAANFVCVLCVAFFVCVVSFEKYTIIGPNYIQALPSTNSVSSKTDRHMSVCVHTYTHTMTVQPSDWPVLEVYWAINTFKVWGRFCKMVQFSKE